MAALSREMIDTNTAIASALGRGGHVAYSLTQGATFTEALASDLLSIVAAGSSVDHTLVYLAFSAAGSIILGSADAGSTALEAAAGAIPAEIDTTGILSHHATVFVQLIEALENMPPDQERTLKALRATTCSPEAILACVRRLFSPPQDGWQGVHGEGRCCPL